MNADYFSKDVEAFILLLHAYQVEYVIVGGEAVIYYGYPRLTGDVDFFYGSSQSNIEALFNALSDFWDGNIPGIEKRNELEIPDTIIQFGVPPNRIDLMNRIDGVEFEDAWKEKKSESIRINNNTVPVYFISLEHLIKNKTLSARNKDLDDLSYLKNVK